MKVVQLFLLLISTQLLFAANNDLGNIKGSIRSLDGVPISNVSITLQKTSKGAITDDNGGFQIKKIK